MRGPHDWASGSLSGARFAPELGEHFFEWGETLGINEAKQAELEMQARIGLAAKVVIRREQNVEKAREILFAELRGLSGKAWAFVGGCGDQIRLRAANAHDQQIAEVTDRLSAEMLEVLSIGDQPMNQAERAFGRLSGDCFDKLIENAFGYYAQKFADLRI